MNTNENVGTFFGWADYLTFSVFLLTCCVIGLYFGLIRTSSTLQEYLLGGRRMKCLPIGISLAANFVSAVMLLGVPSEIYVYGVQYVFFVCAFPISALFYQATFLPIYMDLKITSAYEYLERRYNRNVRYFGLFLFGVNIILWLALGVYVASLAFNQFTGFNLYGTTAIIFFICIFYTSVGGIKAIVWNDVLQVGLMLTSIVIIAVKGTIEVGGFWVVIERNLNSTRLEPPNFSLDPTIRQTFWSLLFGSMGVVLSSNITNQSTIQKYLSLPQVSTAKISLWIFMVLITLISLICVYIGLLIYAFNYQCDPFKAKHIQSKDQLVPFFVTIILRDYPGLTGVFFGGIFSATLSSASGGLNALATIIVNDFSKLIFKRQSEKRSIIVIKLTVVVLGCICGCMVPVIKHLGLVNQLNFTINALTSGCLLSFFCLGIFLPWVTPKGVIAGGITSIAVVAWFSFKAQEALVTKKVHFLEKPVSLENCNVNISHVEEKPSISEIDEVFVMYRLSYLYYIGLGTIICIIVSILFSLIDSYDSESVDVSLLAPCVRGFYKKSKVVNNPHPNALIVVSKTHIENNQKVPEYEMATLLHATI